MSLWSFRKKAQEPADTDRAQKTKRTVKRSPPVVLEVKVLAIEALEAGLSVEEAGELAGVSPATVLYIGIAAEDLDRAVDALEADRREYLRERGIDSIESQSAS